MNAPVNTESAIVVSDIETLSNYGIDLAQIEAVRRECEGKRFDGTPTEYKDGVRAIAKARDTRVAIDERRQELNKDPIERQRRVNLVARELTALIKPIEDDLKARKDAADEAKRIAKEAEEQRKRDELEAKIRAEREAEEARLKAEREAKEKQLAEERAAFESEKARLAEEQRVRDEAAKSEAERVKREQEAESQRLAEKQAELEAEAKRIKDEAEAKASAERERIEAEERRVAELERQAELQRRLEALKPDADKIHEFAAKLSELVLSGPELATEEANEFMQVIVNSILNETFRMEQFGR